MSKLGKNAKGCRQTTLLEADVPSTPDLVEAECKETREYWRRRATALRVRFPDFVVIEEEEGQRAVAR